MGGALEGCLKCPSRNLVSVERRPGPYRREVLRRMQRSTTFHRHAARGEAAVAGAGGAGETRTALRRGAYVGEDVP
jgi:hypothetical protein